MGRCHIDSSQSGILGEGSSCVCRKGRLVKTGEYVAIKVYKASKSSFSAMSHEACLKKHRRSVAVLQKLQEPFVQPVDPTLWNSQLDRVKPANLFMKLLDYSQDDLDAPGYDRFDTDLHVVTELAQYSLKDIVSQRKLKHMPLSKETVRSITKAILLVVAGLHAKGFVHLDMKPENLMVFDGCLKLIDVDGCVEIGTSISRRDRSISFSPCYCAPEWAGFVLGRDISSIPALPGLDSWSVGCTICELVTLDVVLRPTYKKFSETSTPNHFMDWLTRLEKAPVPHEVEQFDSELLQLLTGCLLVCPQSERRTCAQSLDTPYISSDKLRRTKSNPVRVQADDRELPDWDVPGWDKIDRRHAALRCSESLRFCGHGCDA